LRSSSKLSRYFQFILFEFIVEKVWFGLGRQFGQTNKINGFWFALVCLIKFGMILFAYSTDKQIN